MLLLAGHRFRGQDRLKVEQRHRKHLLGRTLIMEIRCFLKLPMQVLLFSPHPQPRNREKCSRTLSDKLVAGATAETERCQSLD